MTRQPEKLLYAALLALLAACSDKPAPAASAPQTSAPVPAAAPAFNRADPPPPAIRNARRAPKAEVSASDIEAAGLSRPADGFQAASMPEDVPPLPPVCEEYYRRTDQCFAQQGEDAEALRQSNQSLRLELARSRPTEAECTALNQSFDNLAAYLGCRG